MNDTSFPRLYATHVAQFTEDLALWRDLANSCGSPILELGCGPGRVVMDLAKTGFTITGLDSDLEMIRWTRAQIDADLLEKVNFIHADMREFSLSICYNLIIMPCNTFAYFNDYDAHTILTEAKKHLTSKGKLAIVIPNPKNYDYTPVRFLEGESEQSEPIQDFIEPVSQHPVQVYAHEAFREEDNILEVIWIFDELLPDGRVKRIQHNLVYHLRSLDETLGLFKNADLDVINIYGDYRKGPLQETSHEIILLAENTINT
jgi:SAM-dependent methyltransferase